MSDDSVPRSRMKISRPYRPIHDARGYPPVYKAKFL